MDIAEGVVNLCFILGLALVIRMRGESVTGSREDHAPDLIIRVDLMGKLSCKPGGNQFIVHGVEQFLFIDLPAGDLDPAGQERLVEHRVDLVEGQPVRHASAVALEDGTGVGEVEVDEFAVAPATVFPGRCSGVS